MKKILLIIIFLAISGMTGYWFFLRLPKSQSVVIFPSPAKYFWKIQSIDTMKFSRDVAAEKLADSSFDVEIERQVSAIADTGATHIAIGTPYDEKFSPFMQRWVSAARRHHLKVWFRGNWSNWEGWFDYAKNMTREEHIEKTKTFILDHADIFSDGDIFSACPECENGGPGDPRFTGDVAGYRRFLIDEYAVKKVAFDSIQKNVQSNYFSMNGDVARLIMDKKTTEALGGIVTIDHYVESPEKLANDIREIARASGGRVVLGEWGVSIPDIHETMSDDERAQWMGQALKALASLGGELEGMNYWTAVGGSTELWSQGAKTSALADVLRKYYTPQIVYGRLADELGRPVSGARVSIPGQESISRPDGYFELRSPEKVTSLSVFMEGYASEQIAVSDADRQINIVLSKEKKDIFFRVALWFKKL